jgi:DNA repair exonuclease SbcCD ATPase subunit
MWSGRETLASIDQALHQVRSQTQELDAEIQRASTRLVELRQAEAACYKQLAQLRLGQLVSGEIVAGFAAADRRVGEVLEQRQQALQALQQQLEALQAGQQQLESERESQRQRVAEAAEQLDRAEAATQKRLQDDQAYQEQLQKAHAADAVAKQAEAKTEHAEQDRLEKGRPYEAEPLFMYLWKRGYGTADYSANPLVRFFDKQVARLCNYHNARPNYAMLLEIPTRLREHATRMRAAADQEFEALTAIERAAAEADGIPALRQAVEEAERSLDAIDDHIQEAAQRVRQQMEARASYAAGEDELSQQALSALIGQFEREGIMALRRQAEATRSTADDRIVQELAEIDQQQAAMEETLARHKQLYTRSIDRLQQLQEVRHRFKRERYDDVHSSFADTAMLSLILNEFLRGVASSNDLWGTLRRQQRYRRIESDPEFGSGGFGRSGSTWRFPAPSGGGFGGGGFGSGGGIRGGGFRTGGGF